MTRASLARSVHQANRTDARRWLAFLVLTFELLLPVWAFGATEIPTVLGAGELFRYPYLQTDSPRRMKVLWGTATTGTGELQYRLVTDASWTNVASTTTLFPASLTGQTTDFTQHETVLENLQPGGQYVYNVVHNGVVLASGVPFEAMAENAGDTVQFIAMGDSGDPYSGARRVRDEIVRKDAAGNFVYPHDFVVSLGDHAYYSGTYLEYENNFFRQLSGKGDMGNGSKSLLADRPIFLALGNHEYNGGSCGSTCTPTGYHAYFSHPLASGIPAQDAERYYSFDSGNAHFVVVDSMKFDTAATRLNEMLTWIDADLAATTKPWKMVFFHHAPFSYGPHGTWGDPNLNLSMRKNLAPILQRRGVQLVLFGHDHLYQRSKPLKVFESGANLGKIVRDANNILVEKGVTYVGVGIGGTDLNNPSIAIGNSYCWGSTSDPICETYDFVAYRNGEPVLYGASTTVPASPTVRLGFLQVAISGTQLTGSAYNYQGEVMDQFTIDLDSDQDGVPDRIDNCPMKANPDQLDTDGDGVGNVCDNCILKPNANQRDTNGDGYGNVCDPDLNNDNVVNFVDVGIMKSVFYTSNPDADLNGDGAVNFVDYGILKSMMYQAPGPSGLVP